MKRPRRVLSLSATYSSVRIQQQQASAVFKQDRTIAIFEQPLSSVRHRSWNARNLLPCSYITCTWSRMKKIERRTWTTQARRLGGSRGSIEPPCSLRLGPLRRWTFYFIEPQCSYLSYGCILRLHAVQLSRIGYRATGFLKHACPYSLEFEVEAERMYPLSPKALHENLRHDSEGKKDITWTKQLRWDVSRRDEKA